MEVKNSRMPRNLYEPLKTYFLKVNINCQGCKRKVKKTLGKLEGVYSVDINTDQQSVIVRGNLDPEILVKKLNKRGKHAEILFFSPSHKNQPGLNHDIRSLKNTQNHFNNFPSYDEEMMMMNMKPVMMSDEDYFQMRNPSENFEDIFGEIPRRHNYEEMNPNLMTNMNMASKFPGPALDMDLGYSNGYPALEKMKMGIGGRVEDRMMNGRGFRGGPALAPQFMNHEQFNTRQLHGSYY